MSLLRYEFTDAPASSFNGKLGQLVKDVRHYYSYAPAEEFASAMPNLRTQERALNAIQSEIGIEPKNYIEDIMAELTKESELEEILLKDIEYSCKAIISELLDTTISLDEFSYTLRNSEAVHWMTFDGYADERKADAVLIVLRDVFKSVCYKMGVVFIDLSRA